MIINNIDYLFHYTSIENLALILKNRTIRLNPLNNMDDLQESRSHDLHNIGRFFFASSWTDDSTENIPMWNMYTKIESGVRIGLPKNPFTRHNTSREHLSEFFKSPISGEESVDTFLDLAKLIKEHAYSVQAWSGDILSPIIYTNEKELLEPKVVSVSEERISLDISNIGKYKNKYWEFQKEWRYMMMFIPFTITDRIDEMQNNFDIIVNRMARDIQAAPFDYYDLDIREDAMKSMIITPSPKISAGNEVILDALVKRYNSEAVLKKSELCGLV